MFNADDYKIITHFERVYGRQKRDIYYQVINALFIYLFIYLYLFINYYETKSYLKNKSIIRSFPLKLYIIFI